MCAADLSAVGGILTRESAATVPAAAVESVEDGLAASRASISLKMTNDEFARYLDVQMRSLTVWLLEHGHLSPTPASRSSLSSCKSSTPNQSRCSARRLTRRSRDRTCLLLQRGRFVRECIASFGLRPSPCCASPASCAGGPRLPNQVRWAR